MNSPLHFSAITKAIFKTDPTYPPSYPYPKNGENEVDPALLAEYTEKKLSFKAHHQAFNAQVDKHMQSLIEQHAGEKDYYVSAIPFSQDVEPYHHGVLIIDGNDLKQYAFDLLLETQKIYKALSDNWSLPKPKDPTPSDYLSQAEIPQGYNWKQTEDHRNTLDSYDNLSTYNVKNRYANKATLWTIDA
ncbi:MAG: hypothetical protein K2X66_11405 [Cyanobacteria bacterium]|nr:hypothetical protein [Cyanobacteriota bacterium]